MKVKHFVFFQNFEGCCSKLSHIMHKGIRPLIPFELAANAKQGSKRNVHNPFNTAHYNAALQCRCCFSVCVLQYFTETHDCEWAIMFNVLLCNGIKTNKQPMMQLQSRKHYRQENGFCFLFCSDIFSYDMLKPGSKHDLSLGKGNHNTTLDSTYCNAYISKINGNASSESRTTGFCQMAYVALTNNLSSQNRDLQQKVFVGLMRKSSMKPYKASGFTCIGKQI